MKVLLAALFCCASLGAQSLTFLIDNTGGAASSSNLPALTSSYQFPETAVGSSSSIVIRVVNSSEAAITIGPIYVGASAGLSTPNQNFTVTGWDQGAILAPAGWQEFILTFAPLTSGQSTGYMQALENDLVTSVSTLLGTSVPGLALTCSGVLAQCNGNPFNNSAPLNFSTVPDETSSSVTFTFTNQTSAALNAPSVSLQTQEYLTSAFSIDTSALPDMIGPALSASFTLTFAPVQPSSLLVATLLIGSSAYQVQGIPTGGLQISYVDSTGIRYTPASNSIAFGQVNGAATLAFTVTNPIAATSAALVSVSVSGVGFSLSGAPATAATLQADQSLTFQLTFAGSQTGSGALTIGTQVFALTASVSAPIGVPGSALPGVALFCGASACTAQAFTDAIANLQDVQMTLQLSSAAPVQSDVTLTAAFTPSIVGVSGDPMIQFIAPITGPSLSLTFAAGSRTATYKSQQQLTFQPGTTAGTITFTLTYLGQPTTLATVVIPGVEVQNIAILAQRQDPNLVVTVSGYDNTYSIGQLAFTFYGVNGGVIPSTPFQATLVASDFHQYFFGPTDIGGGFSVQATFPVLVGDVTQIDSVAVTLTNSVGTTTPITQPFQ